jgi:hypothetical protein
MSFAQDERFDERLDIGPHSEVRGLLTKGHRHPARVMLDAEGPGITEWIVQLV